MVQREAAAFGRQRRHRGWEVTSPLLSYSFALGCVALATLLRLLLNPLLGPEATPFPTYFLACAIVMRFTGPGPSMAAIITSPFVADWFFLPPIHSFGTTPGQYVIMAVFVLTNVLILGLAQTMRRARAQAEANDRAARERSALLDLAPIFGWHLDDTLFMWGRGAEALYGFTPAEALGQHSHQLLKTRFAEPFEAIRARVLKEGGWEGELVQQRKDGSWLTVLSQWIVLWNENGAPMAVLETCWDVTRRKQAEAALVEAKQSLERERNLLQAVMDGASESHLVYLDGHFNFVRVNRTYARTCGYTPEAMVGKNHFALYPHAENEAIFARVRDTGEAARCDDKPFAFPDQPERGVTYWDWTLTPVKEGGQVVGLVFALYETTKRKRAQEALAQKERKYRQLFDSMTEGFLLVEMVCDSAGKPISYRYLEANPALEPLTHRKREEFLGKDVREVLPGEQHWIEAVGRVATTGEPLHVEDYSPTLQAWYEVYIYRPEPGKAALIFSNITPRKQAEQALAAAREQLRSRAEDLEKTVRERTARLQDMVGELQHFSYAMMHDMRAPLRALRSYSDLLLSQCAGQLQPRHEDLLQRMQAAAERMDALVTDALQYSKAVQEELALRPVNAVQLLRGMVQSYPQFQPPKAEIRIEEAMPLVLANAAALTQCFSSLLNNAVQYVQPGKMPAIRVWAEARKPERESLGASECRAVGVEHAPTLDAPNVPYVRLWFEDNGIGIAQAHQEQIWRMFQRLHVGHEGTGMGLALVRKLVERMKGRAGVDSEPGQGSRFWVELQAADN